MIIDTHTHFYDPTRPQGVPWPAKDRGMLYRPVLPDHFRALAAPLGVTGTVVVEASPWPEDNQWILDLADRDPLLVGHVGHLQPGTPEFAGQLDRFCRNPRFRGIRVSLSSQEAWSAPPYLADLERMAAKDLVLDVNAEPQTVGQVPRLADLVPALRLVLCHVAQVRIDGRAPDPVWGAGIREAALRPNVFCKVSALPELTGQQPAPADLSYYAPTLDVLWQAFGAERLIYGSNWPVSEPFAPYAAVLRLTTAYLESRGQEALTRGLAGNATQVYKPVL